MGAALNGSVTTSSKSIAVRTPSGAVIVFDRGDVMQVTHGKVSVALTASKSANSKIKSQPKKRKLTAEEDAWMPKVRQVVGRLYAADREKSRRAQTELLNIDDTDALPALSTYLGSSRSAEGRRLYVAILHNIKGPKPVYYLVALSLFDPFPEIREEARKAFATTSSTRPKSCTSPHCDQEHRGWPDLQPWHSGRSAIRGANRFRI